MSPAAATVAGVDGCKGGWVIAIAHLGASVTLTMAVVETFAEVMTRTADCAVVGVDMPLALPVDGLRASDAAVKEHLGVNGRSLFWTPTRAAIAQDNHAAAVRVNKARGGKGPSAQGWGLAAKIREARQALGPQPDPRILEVHPESSFVVLAGEPLPSKRTAQGVGRRLGLLSAWAPTAAAALASVPLKPATTTVDDALDAMAAAWTAQRVAEDRAQWFGARTRDDEGFLIAVAV